MGYLFLGEIQVSVRERIGYGMSVPFNSRLRTPADHRWARHDGNHFTTREFRNPRVVIVMRGAVVSGRRAAWNEQTRDHAAPQRDPLLSCTGAITNRCAVECDPVPTQNAERSGRYTYVRLKYFFP